MDFDLLNTYFSFLYPILLVFVTISCIYFVYYLVKTAIEHKIREEVKKAQNG